METKKVQGFRFFPGLAGLFVGFTMWFLVSIVSGINRAVTGKNTDEFLLAATFAIMVLTPLWYWALRVPYIAGKVKHSRWLSIPPVVIWWSILALIIYTAIRFR